MIWAEAQLKAAGAQNVHRETFTILHGWERGTARLRIVGPPSRTIRIESLGWSPSTRKGGARGPLVLMRGFENIPKDVNGKVVLIERPAGPPPPGPGWWIAYRKAFGSLQAAGARAVLVQVTASMPNNVISTGTPSEGGNLLTLPGGVIGFEDGTSLARQLESSVVTAEVEITNTISGPTEVANVIGDLPGKTRGGEWVIVGGHLDSWDFATGAQDNGAGAIQVIQTARLLAAAGPLERTVRFALWAGEEQGLVGSQVYVTAHAGELGSCVAAFNGLAVVAVTTYALAATSASFAPRLDRATVENMFKPGGWDNLMRSNGWWK